MIPEKPVVLITRNEGQLNVYSDEHVGAEAWILDWDNDMQPTRFSTVIDQSDLGPPSFAHRIAVVPHSAKSELGMQAMRTAFKVAESERAMSHTGRNTILAALRLLQLHIEKDDIPQGIQESFFDTYDRPSPEALDRLCEALNT